MSAGSFGTAQPFKPLGPLITEENKREREWLGTGPPLCRAPIPGQPAVGTQARHL